MWRLPPPQHHHCPRHKYPLPNLMDLSANMDGCTVFSKIDLVKAFHQVPIAPEDRKKTAVITPFGLFEYNYMPFDFCNAAQTLQRLQDNLFQDLPFVFVYLDDGRVASRNLDEHVDHLRAIFRVFRTMGLPSTWTSVSSPSQSWTSWATASALPPSPLFGTACRSC
jgi:Reverse transcriptase (RNA-dependent DNA polymerase)